MKKFLVLLLILPAVITAFTEFYYLPIRFPDNPQLARRLIIDISNSPSYVLDAEAFPDLGLNVTVDFSKSPTNKKTGQKFETLLESEFNSEFDIIFGQRYEDVLDFGFTKFRSIFGAVNKAKVESITGLDGSLAVGRVGFRRRGDKEEAKEDLRDKVLEKFKEKHLCFGTAVADNGSKKITRVGLGGKIFNEKNLITTAYSFDDDDQEYNKGGVWRLSVGGMRVGKGSGYPAHDMILSTTSDKIILHYSLFNAAMSQLGATFDSTLKKYTADCNTNIPIEFAFGGKYVPIQFSSFTKPIGDGRCTFKLQSHTEKVFYVGVSLFVNNGVCMDFAEDMLSFYNIQSESLSLVGESFRRTNENVEFITYN